MSQTSKLPKIKITSATGKRCYIPLTHNVYSTQKVGKITPYMCRFMDANAKAKINLETLEYNAPMVSPTVGNIKLKHWLYFVGLDKLSPVFANMFAKMPAVNSDAGEYQVEKVPSLELRELTALCLIGSFCTIYVRNKLNAPPEQSREMWETGVTYLMSSANEHAFDFENYWNGFAQGQLFNTNSQNQLEPKICITKYASRVLGGMDCFTFNAKYLFLSNDINDLTNNDECIPIPLANPTKDSFLDWRISREIGGSWSEETVYNNDSYLNLTHGIDCSPVSIRKPDYAVTRTFTVNEGGGRTRDIDVTFCFRFSDFGRALRDIMVAAGYQLNVASSKRVSFLPFIATYLAYFECQSLQLYKNWQNTSAFKIMRRFETENVWNLSTSFKNIQINSIDSNLFVEFVNDLASMWAIEPQDFVSCHTRSPITSPLAFNNLDAFINGVDNEVANQDGGGYAPRVPIDQTNTTAEPSDIEDNHIPFIDRIKHDVVTAELLRKLTLRMNVNSVIGRKTVQLLRNAGFGEWVDLQKATFIDYGEMRLDLKPVIATADTSSDGKGADLGQYGGRGYGHKVHKPKTFMNKVGGYYILMTAVYVDAGYCQSIDPYNYQTEVDDFYKREFDSLGYELDEKNQVHGSLTFAVEGDHGKLDESFGYAPRDTKYKHIHNKLLGYFTDGELSDVYETYQLEKMLPVGSPVYSNEKFVPIDEMPGQEGSITIMTRGARFAPSLLPIAGNIWRYLGRFPWLGRFDRIFKLQDYDIRKVKGLYGVSEENFLENVMKIYSYFITSPENYACLNTIYFDSWQDKKPISESFGTLSEIFDGFAKSAVDKE